MELSVDFQSMKHHNICLDNLFLSIRGIKWQREDGFKVSIHIVQFVSEHSNPPGVTQVVQKHSHTAGPYSTFHNLRTREMPLLV